MKFPVLFSPFSYHQMSQVLQELIMFYGGNVEIISSRGKSKDSNFVSLMPWSRRKICNSNLILNIIIREKKKLNKAEDLIRIYES